MSNIHQALVETTTELELTTDILRLRNIQYRAQKKIIAGGMRQHRKLYWKMRRYQLSYILGWITAIIGWIWLGLEMGL